jgi:hypothetical protein
MLALAFPYPGDNCPLILSFGMSRRRSSQRAKFEVLASQLGCPEREDFGTVSAAGASEINKWEALDKTR